MSDLCEAMTLREIAAAVGLASGGHAHDLKSGKQKSVPYEIGLKLVALHKKVMKRKNARPPHH